MACGERAGGGGITGKERHLAYAQRDYGMGQLNPTPDTPSFRVLLGHKKGNLKEQVLLESGEGVLWDGHVLGVIKISPSSNSPSS